MSSEHAAPPAQRSHSGAVSVGSNLGGLLLSVAGVFNFVQGLVAVTRSPLYVVTTDYLFRFDPTTWGWIHLILGSIVAATGLGLFAAANSARLAAIFFIAINAVAQIVWFPAAPLWAFLMIILDVTIIYQLTARWEE